MKTVLVFVTGGARSGKSDYAVSIAEASGGWPVYLATATAADPEMAERIEKHRRERGAGWSTLEVPLDIRSELAGLTRGENSLVIDCLTLWLTNIMMADEKEFERKAGDMAAELLSELKSLGGTVVVVSNEVGMGIVPDNALARRFRDVAGSVNRMFADAADEVYLLVSGLPVKLK